MRCGLTFAFVSFLAATALGAELPPQMRFGAWCPQEENIQTAALVEPTYVLLLSSNACRHESSIGMWCPEGENIQTAALFEPTHVLLPSGDICRSRSAVGTWGNFFAEVHCTHMPDGGRVSITWIGDTISFRGSIPGENGEQDASVDVVLQRCPDDEPIFIVD